MLRHVDFFVEGVLVTVFPFQCKTYHGRQTYTRTYHFHDRHLHRVQLPWRVKYHHVIC